MRPAPPCELFSGLQAIAGVEPTRSVTLGVGGRDVSDSVNDWRALNSVKRGHATKDCARLGKDRIAC